MGNTTDDNTYHNHSLRIWTKISDETGVNWKMVGHIHNSITKERKDEVHINSKNATQFIILDLINNDNGSVEGILKYNGINASDDFGLIVKKLCEEKLLIQEEGDRFEDFNGLFQTESIDKFIKLHKLKKAFDWYKITCYALCLIGFVVLIKFSFYGWVLSMLGYLLLTYKKKIVFYFNKIKKQ